MIESHPITDHVSWLAMRAHDLTASDIAAAIGDSPFKTTLELYAEKTGHLMPKPETPLMKRGRLLEPVVVAMIRDENPDWQVEYPLDLYIRDPLIRLGATPDARAVIDGETVNLQLKVVNRASFEREWVQDHRPPKHYLYQTAVEGMLMDVDRSMIVVLVVDYAALSLFYFDVPRHPEAEARFREHAVAFWDNVATGKRPAADLKRDADTLAALYPQSQKEPVLDLSTDNALPDMLKVLRQHEAEIAARQAVIDEVRVYIKDKMGPAEIAELPGWRITWRTMTIKEHVRAASTFRRLLVSEVRVDEEEKAA